MGDFEDRVNFLNLWLIRSEELSLAAKTTWDTLVIKGATVPTNIHQLYRPAVLLMGLSLEVLIKGFIIKSNPSLVVNAKLPKNLQTHSLTQLFSMAGIKLNKTEISTLVRWTESVIWVSKYAVPLKESQLKTGALIRYNSDFELFEKLRQKVFLHFKFDSTKISRYYF